jgi:mycobactin peptide synthetase MbtE
VIDRGLEDIAARLISVRDRQREQIAVIGPGATWTYSELLGRAAAVASTLENSGAGRGSRIGLIVDHDEHAVTAVLGAMLAGAAYVPLDRRWPVARRIEVALDADLDALLTVDVGEGARLSLDAHPVIDLFAAERTAHFSGAMGGEPSDIAYILYTSGSTGRPKGVVQTRRNLTAHADIYRSSVQIGPTDRVALLSRISFDACVMDLFGALLSGACLCIADPTSEAGLGTMLRQGEITILHATPTLLRHIMRHTFAVERESLRCVVSGGEALLAADANLLRTALDPGVLVVNGYGPTECTTALQYQVRAASLDPDKPVPLGHPFPGVCIDVVGSNGESVPEGQVGELVLSSPCLTEGYWRRPDLTAAAFALRGPSRAYGTGDFVRRGLDGSVVFVGRRDTQVKIRGCRVEIGEVESCLLAYAGVSSAAVIVNPGVRSSGVLSAFVSGIAPAALDGLRAALSARLIPEAIPGTVEILDRLPLTASGKIDRAALANHVPAKNNGSSSADPLLVEVIARELGIHVRPDDNFLRLGGDSLAAMTCATELSAALGVTVPVVWFFETPIIGDLSNRIAALSMNPRRSSIPRQKVFPMPPAHRRYWARIQAGEPAAAFHLLIRSKITGSLDVPRFQRALTSVVERHPWLRTGFELRDREPVCVVHDEPRLTALVGDFEMAEDNFGSLQPVRPFALESPPLARISLTKITATTYVLDCLWHHLIMDGWSRRQFERELFGACAGAKLFGKSVVPELQPGNTNAELDPDGRAGLVWWQAHLDGVQPLDARALTGDATPGVTAATLRIPSGLSKRARAAAADADCSLFTLLLTALAVVVADATGQERFAITTDIARRQLSPDEIGLFTDVLVLPLSVPREWQWPELLRGVKSILLGAMRHEVSFEQLMSDVVRHPLAHYDQVFPVGLFLERADAPRPYGDLLVTTHEISLGELSRDLIVTAIEADGGEMVLRATARTGNGPALRRLLGGIVTTLTAGVDTLSGKT